MTANYTVLHKNGESLCHAATDLVAAMASLAEKWDISDETLKERYPEIAQAHAAIMVWKAGVS